ncbi:MAG: sensor histidine kinase, partial [Vicinamibacterales bacterium]
PESTIMREIIERIDALTELIQDLQFYARPHAPRLETLDLHRVLLDAIASMRRDPVAEHVKVDVEGAGVMLAGDSELIRAAFLNVLLNAAQAMNGRGAIHISISRGTDAATVRVRDEGPGIAADIRERVFEPFFTTKARGGGLGLAIVRRTTVLHGGTVAIDIPAEGGTVVSMTLPLKPPTAAQEMPAVSARA